LLSQNKKAMVTCSNCSSPVRTLNISSLGIQLCPDCFVAIVKPTVEAKTNCTIETKSVVRGRHGEVIISVPAKISFRGAVYDFGIGEVRLRPSSSGEHIVVDAYASDRKHPHAGQSGHMCADRYESRIATDIANFDIASLIMDSIALFATYTPTGAYHGLYTCSVCGDPAEAQCSYCGNWICGTHSREKDCCANCVVECSVCGKHVSPRVGKAYFNGKYYCKEHYVEAHDKYVRNREEEIERWQEAQQAELANRAALRKETQVRRVRCQPRDSRGRFTRLDIPANVEVASSASE